MTLTIEGAPSSFASVRASSRETLAAPGELLGQIQGARQDHRPILAQSERSREVLLDRDLAVELGVAGEIGDAEATLAEHRDQLIAVQQRAGSQHAAYFRVRSC